ncbi:DNA primase [Micrococcoides hystricis]|uniref:DNA primase n=1 Tax=Micrococcoides hystricis TaxID=1572761 RepID=A0ABV6PAV5_9MICC
MAGLIKREVIDRVRERADLKEIVDSYVTLRSAGVGSFKGLCPFHDERTPSFHIRPQVGTFHCFGCGESGDVFSFLMKMEHTTFSETVEQLAAKYQVELEYEDGGTGPNKHEVGRRQRLLDAHRIAEEFFVQQLAGPEAATARNFLTERGFDAAAAKHFGVGYAPKGWDNLLKLLRDRGFREDELRATGLFSEGNRGPYDRFRGRLMWPIRDLVGATIGFGARKLYDDDQGPKYLNTPETQLYKKSEVLYGLDLAKRSISKSRQLIVVEGYTDVMAAHLAGLDTAVATCGTAFGADHIKVVRRLIADDGTGGEVIFTFDGDEAGQKAALRAFDEDHRFLAQTFVAVEPSGMDPCDLRQERGDAAVRALIENRRPLFEFAIRATLKNFNLDTVEGRVAAMRSAAPIVAGIKDPALRPAYMRELAGWLGTDVETVRQTVQAALRGQLGPRPGQHTRQQNQAGPARPEQLAQHPPAFNLADPVVRMEREALEVVLQQPDQLSAEQFMAFYHTEFKVPAHAAIHAAIRAVAAADTPVQRWVEAIREEVPVPLRALVSELAVTTLPAATEEHLVQYCRDIMNRLFELSITQQKSDLLGRLQRLGSEATAEESRQIQRQLLDLETRRRRLREDQ